MGVSVLFRIDGNRNIEVVADGPAPGRGHRRCRRTTTRQVRDHYPRRRRPRSGAKALAVVTCPGPINDRQQPLPAVRDRHRRTVRRGTPSSHRPP